MKPTIRFKARLSKDFLSLPKSASVKLQLKGNLIIEGVINSIPFKGALKIKRGGDYQLKVGKAMFKAISADIGDIVPVEITRVGDEKETRVPTDLSRSLASIPKAKSSWADITPLARRDWIFSISSAKQPETRKRRIEKACDMLRSGKRRLCCFPGIKWMMKENAKACGMWAPLKS